MEADEPEVGKTSNNEESGDDREPGASAASVFITADSVIDLEAYGANGELKQRPRLPSGLIAAIKSGEDELRVSNRVRSKSTEITDILNFIFYYS